MRRARSRLCFTDIAGFSPYAEALSPTDLIAILDRYFAGLTLIVHAHGGMVDKFVGDAAHVLFNAPFNQPDHCAQAVNAGQALQAYGVEFAADAANQGLGITCVGMECGVLVVGDVGAGDVGAGEKLDYTAHGRAMNIAAWLEQAGKSLGVTLLAGPALHAALPALPRQSMGKAELRGFGAVAADTLPSHYLMSIMQGSLADFAIQASASARAFACVNDQAGRVGHGKGWNLGIRHSVRTAPA